MMRVHGLTVGVAVMLAAGLAACSSSSTAPSNNGGGGQGGGASNTVTAYYGTTGGGAYSSSSWYFAPTPDTVTAGTAVTFMWSGAMHNVHFDAVANAPDSIATSNSASVSRTFTTPGTYNYTCTIHNMSGTVVVQ
jgi:plastocyanin